ncbi:ABC transporter ATP-binding protein [Bacillus sp. HMF5848]|uniref:ABC transporter ATP-binding protein n=1 Tax=Bacillus sp. HMF5848 TaxID=2495421 RepID=UPI000F7B7FF3|nr:ABC transporter ATP-binding protein [Bacillus sp. HMF5848]RSK28260.1 ABC transporter ATP-binding protein [Bacillus sp. HMF5848]
MSFLTLHNIHHIYFSKTGATTALEDISINIEEGEFISFLGPSGCGKTTLLSIIAGLLQPTEGEVRIDGEVIKESTSAIGYMLQQDYLFPWKTILDNILIGPRIMGAVTKETHEKAVSLLQSMGLEYVENAYPRELSGGMRQRVALVRTLITNPKLLLLDEPFSALDYQTKLKLEDLVADTLKQFKKTALLVTHDIGEAIAMSDRIFLLSSQPGKIARTFIVPAELRKEKPFHVRQHEQYNEFFQKVWKELDNLETNVGSRP